MTLTLRNVPEIIHQRLKRQALENRRSLNQEAVSLLERVLAPEKGGRAAVLARIVAETKEARSRSKGYMTIKEIEAAIGEGRA